MRRLLSLLLLILSAPAFGADLADRSRIPDRSVQDGRPVYVASLAPLRTTYLPQIIPLPGGGGGGGMSIGGTVTGGTATRVLFVGAGDVIEMWDPERYESYLAESGEELDDWLIRYL